MADIYCCHFEYGGISSRTHGLHFVNVETDRFINVQGQISGVNIFNKRSKRNYLIDTDYTSSPVSYDIDIVTDDERTLNKLEQEEVERWLFNRAKNMKLYIDPDDDYDFGTYDKYQIVTSRPNTGQEVGVVYLVLSSGTTYTAKRWNGTAYEDMSNVTLSGTTMTEATGSPTITSTFSRSGNTVIAHRRFLRCRFINPTKLEYNGGIVGYRVTLEADTGWWLQDPVTYTYSVNQSAGATSNISLTPNTDSDTYIYPRVTITSGSSGGFTDGANGRTLSPVATSSNKYYRCIVTRNGVSTTSDAALVRGYNVSSSPYVTVVKQPVNTIGFIGYPVSFSIEAVGNGLSYQWMKKKRTSSTWENLGVNGDTLPEVTFNMTSAYDVSHIKCVVTDINDHSVNSNTVTLDANTVGETSSDGTSIIRTNPQNITAKPGDRVSFSVEAYGEDITYQWQVSKDNGSTWKNCTGEGNNNIIYGFEAVSGNDGWQFRCVVSGTIHYMIPSVDPGESPEDAQIDKTFTSSAATLTVVTNGAPIITSQPTSTYTVLNGTVDLSVEAQGDGLTYQWQVSSNGTSGWTNLGSGTILIINQTDNAARKTELTDMPISTTIVLDGETNYVSGDYYKILGSRHFPRILPFRTNTFTLNGPVNTIIFEVENRRNL